jgi:hypothetical protein
LQFKLSGDEFGKQHIMIHGVKRLTQIEKTYIDCRTISHIIINNIPYTINHVVATKMLLKTKLKVAGYEIITKLVNDSRLE